MVRLLKLFRLLQMGRLRNFQKQEIRPIPPFLAILVLLYCSPLLPLVLHRSLRTAFPLQESMQRFGFDATVTAFASGSVLVFYCGPCKTCHL
jgi:hypothetical protein